MSDGLLAGDLDDKRKEFSVRPDWRGRLILRVRTYENLPASGQWIDARSEDLPEFFSRLLGKA